MIELKDIEKTYRVKKREAGIGNAIKSFVKGNYEEVKALKGISFKINEGEIVGYIGPNGAGKSTLMKVLGGTVHKDEGTVIVNGKEVNIRNKHMSQELGIAFVPQELDFISNFTVDYLFEKQSIELILLPQKKNNDE